MTDEKYSRLKEQAAEIAGMMSASEKVVFFGGAGVSTESGIPDFRSADGIYSKYDSREYISPEEILSRSFFDRDTRTFYEFYRENLLHLDAMPNAAHKKLAELEQLGKDITIVTQNIDGLHQKAGSKRVLELHGTVHENRCMKCGQSYSVQYVANEANPIPTCSLCGGIVKPDVVLYEEPLNQNTIIKTIEAISEADMLIIAGTSLAVYPAASFVGHFGGKYVVVVNLGKQERRTRADLTVDAKVGELFGCINAADCL